MRQGFKPLPDYIIAKVLSKRTQMPHVFLGISPISQDLTTQSPPPFLRFFDSPTGVQNPCRESESPLKEDSNASRF
jgi:hypothetical protein